MSEAHAHPSYWESLDEIETLGSCLQGVCDLLCPDGDAIQSRQRDNVAILLGRLLDEQARAMDALRNEIVGGATC